MRKDTVKLGSAAMKPGGYDPDWVISPNHVAHLLRIHDPEGFLLDTTLCGRATGNWPTWSRAGDPACATCDGIAQRLDQAMGVDATPKPPTHF